MARGHIAQKIQRNSSLKVTGAPRKAAGCKVIRAEKASGARHDGRSKLQVRLDIVRPGATLVVTRIDRLARSIWDVQDTVDKLKQKRLALHATGGPPLSMAVKIRVNLARSA